VLVPNPESGDTWHKLGLITAHAQREKAMQFTSLAHLLNVEFLRDCYYSLNRNKAVGIDGVSWAEYGKKLDENLEGLVGRLKRKKYKPLPARRVYIPKNEREKRPLGIPALENKIVECGVKRILESIYEVDFLESSYGFRPRRSCHGALKELNRQVTFHPINHVVEADIKGFFDHVSHQRLMEFIRVRIKDPSMLLIIERFLKAGYIDDGLLVRTEEGTPQGGILSPLLANIFLHYVLDEWYEEKVKKQIRGHCELIRYADDFVCLVRYVDDAQRIEQWVKERFEEYGLQIHPTKSRRISFGRFEKENARKQGRKANTFEFLGFTHYCDTTRAGKFKVGRKTSRKKYVAKCRAMNEWLKKIRNKVETRIWWKTLIAKLRGHYQYYGVSENYRGILRFYQNVLRLVRKWLNRRSQRGRMSWERFNEYLLHYPLPKPKIACSFYN
jgi:group II intron reverse transcriptase/maturase